MSNSLLNFVTENLTHFGYERPEAHRRRIEKTALAKG